MEREIGAAELTGVCFKEPRCTAGRAPHHGGFVRTRSADLDDLSARAVEPATGLMGGNVELPVAVDARYEMAQAG